MQLSDPTPFTFKGKPARMYVMRNDGFCWGRIVPVEDGAPQFDVCTARDQYERTDEDAAAAFTRAARRPVNVEPAAGWLL